MITVDNGHEFIGKALDVWAHHHGVKLGFNRSGKPIGNTYIERFNGRLRDEGISVNWFLDMEEVRRKIEAWRKEYNELRPHSSLSDLTPMEFIEK
jgi:putative transposase